MKSRGWDGTWLVVGALKLPAVDRGRRLPALQSGAGTVDCRRASAACVDRACALLTAFGCDHNKYGGAPSRRTERTKSAGHRTGQATLNCQGRARETPPSVQAPSAPFTAIAVNCAAVNCDRRPHVNSRRRSTSQAFGARTTRRGPRSALTLLNSSTPRLLHS